MIRLTPEKAEGESAVLRHPIPDDKAGLQDQSPEDTDSNWGERPEPNDDERLCDERPPHWDSA
jgi:hypothetical protein